MLGSQETIAKVLYEAWAAQYADTNRRWGAAYPTTRIRWRKIAKALMDAEDNAAIYFKVGK